MLVINQTVIGTKQKIQDGEYDYIELPILFSDMIKWMEAR